MRRLIAVVVAAGCFIPQVVAADDVLDLAYRACIRLRTTTVVNGRVAVGLTYRTSNGITYCPTVMSRYATRKAASGAANQAAIPNLGTSTTADESSAQTGAQ